MPSNKQQKRNAPAASGLHGPELPPKKKPAKFQAAWKELKDDAGRPFKLWLCEKQGQAQCRCCGTLFKTNKKDTIQDHAKSAAHQHKLTTFMQTPNAAEVLKTGAAKQHEQLSAELLLVMACLQRHAPFLLFQYLNPVIKQVFKDSKAGKNWACSREKARILALHGIGPLMHNAVVELLRNNPFSLLIDESSSVGVVQHLALMVRVFSAAAGKVVNVLWRLVCPEGATAEQLTEEIEKQFAQDSIPFSNLLGYGSDNTNTVAGDKTGVRARLKAKQEHLWSIGCAAHIAALIALHSTPVVPLFKVIEDMIRDITGHFSNSCKRREELKEIQGPHTLTLAGVNITRQDHTALGCSCSTNARIVVKAQRG